MKPWMTAAGFVTSLSLLYTARAQDCPECHFGGLAVQLTPALVRAGETVPIRTTITEAPASPTPYGFTMTLAYPIGLLPDAGNIHAIPQPQGAFPDPIASAKNDPATRQVVILVSRGKSPGERDSVLGPVVDLSFTVGGMTPSGTYALSIVSAEVDTASLERWIARPSQSSVQVSKTGGPGDLDGDGQVTVTDALLALKLLVGTVTASPGILKSAMVRPGTGGDEQVTLADVIDILRMAVGILSP
jgi:hypothetical protein